jgi:hypothetical protein
LKVEVEAERQAERDRCGNDWLDKCIVLCSTRQFRNNWLRLPNNAKGQPVLAFTPAANRDPTVFPDPDSLDLTRHVTGHLAFSRGAHLPVTFLNGGRNLRPPGLVLFRLLECFGEPAGNYHCDNDWQKRPPHTLPNRQRDGARDTEQKGHASNYFHRRAQRGFGEFSG